MNKLQIKTTKNDEMINITSEIESFVHQSKISNGILIIHVPHTTAAVTINENADPDVKQDMLFGLGQISPVLQAFEHYEGNSHAHIKSSLIGVDQTVIIENGRLQLGTWQGIYFCEFDGPRSRQVYLKLISTQ